MGSLPPGRGRQVPGSAWGASGAGLARGVLFRGGMNSRLAYRPDTSSSAPAIPAGQRVMQVAEAASWAVMVLGLIAASMVLVQSYLLGG